MQRAVEKYYSVTEVGWLLSFSPGWVRKTFCEAADGPLRGVVKIGDDFRIPASTINEFIDARRLRAPKAEDLGVSARSETELKRKISAERLRRKEASGE
jgi:hypothetical protein